MQKKHKNLPANFEENIKKLFRSIFDDSKLENVPTILTDIIEELSKIIVC